MPISEGRLSQIRDLLPRTPIEGAFGVQYHLGKLLGEGGQGWVYRAAYDEPEGPWVVVKLLRPDVVNDEALARFLREADVLRKLGQSQAPCPSVVRFFDHGIFRHTMADGETYALPFTVLEYVHGTNLQNILAETPGRGLAVGRVRRLFRQMARALSMVHAAQIVHRDLKPSNLLVATDAEQEVMKISDFGLVKRFDVDIKGTVALAGASLGYAPPEQFEMGNRRVSPRTDLFSFAAVLYETLTGLAAFPSAPGESPFQVLSKVLSGPRPQLGNTPSALAPELGERPDLVAILDREIERATAPDPSDRQATLRDFWEAVEPPLRAAAERGPGTTAKLSLPAGPSRGVSDSGIRSAPRRPAEPVPGSVVAAPSSGPMRVVSASLLPEKARAVAIAPDGIAAFALGRFGLFRFDGSAWARVPLPPAVDLNAIQGVLATPAGEVVLYGERGAVIGVGLAGTTHPWAPPDPDVTWLGASLQPNEIIFVGENVKRHVSLLGLMFPGQPISQRPVEGFGRLLAAARLPSGNLLACGETGELVHLGAGPPVPISWGRTGHLLAIAASPDGSAHVVGSGGHALLVSPQLEAKLEPVQTTRDLLAVAIGPTGAAYAGGGDARLVKRTPKGWMRVPLPSTAQGTVRAIRVGPSALTVVFDDGVVVEGALP